MYICLIKQKIEALGKLKKKKGNLFLERASDNNIEKGI